MRLQLFLQSHSPKAIGITYTYIFALFDSLSIAFLHLILVEIMRKVFT